MRKFRYRNKNQLLLILLAVGFFLGIIYENLFPTTQTTATELFSIGNLQRFLQTDLLAPKYIWYVVKSRILFFGIICMLGGIKWKKILVSACLLCIGFFTGSLCVLSVLNLGFKGLLFCFAALFPQVLFYGMQCGILFTYWFNYPERQWNRMKTLFVSLLFLIGVLLEVYVNPVLVKCIISIL